MIPEISFQPLLPLPLLYGLVLLLPLILFASWRPVPLAAIMRMMAFAMLLAALSGPEWRYEEHKALPDIVLVIEDKSPSALLGDRKEAAEYARQQLNAALETDSSLEIHYEEIEHISNTHGTKLGPVLNEALIGLDRSRLSAIILISDGQISDASELPELPGIPLHLFQLGAPDDWDRRIELHDNPGFAILGEAVELRFSVEEEGTAPAYAPPPIVSIRLPDGSLRRISAPIGAPISLSYTPERQGENLIELAIPAEPGELAHENNQQFIQLNGIRERLRVLLVSGTPHTGTRVWRNLLKSDPSVDLVHFTILRGIDDQDSTPDHELSLIAFPVQELFLEKIQEFDLILFDRYEVQGILLPIYMQSIAAYVRSGGALMVIAGPEYAGVQSLYRTSLAEILPGAPNGRVFETAFRPRISDLGQKHPVTAELAAEENAGWGRWHRYIGLQAPKGDVLLDAEGAPLLILDHIGDGRVALLSSDQIWLWERGHEGGGPQQELLRRLAHWLMGEAELSEEKLRAYNTENGIEVTRQTLQNSPAPLTITMPDSSILMREMEQASNGEEYRVSFITTARGIFTFEQDGLRATLARGLDNKAEFSQIIGTKEALLDYIATNGGGIFPIYEKLPELKRTFQTERLYGAGWAGLPERNLRQLLRRRSQPLFPPLIWLSLITFCLLIAWRLEAQKQR